MTAMKNSRMVKMVSTARVLLSSAIPCSLCPNTDWRPGAMPLGQRLQGPSLGPPGPPALPEDERTLSQTEGDQNSPGFSTYEGTMPREILKHVQAATVRGDLNPGLLTPNTGFSVFL
ncbi:uncharacterized protein ACOB8E_004268 isoform 1-T1 [Sarcophilus harrisii]